MSLSYILLSALPSLSFALIFLFLLFSIIFISKKINKNKNIIILNENTVDYLDLYKSKSKEALSNNSIDNIIVNIQSNISELKNLGSEDSDSDSDSEGKNSGEEEEKYILKKNKKNFTDIVSELESQ